VQILVVIPTYWSSINPKIQDQTPDTIYDHPNPLESTSTLPRLLNSLKEADLPKKSTKIAVIVAVTHKILEEKAEEKTKEILKGYKNYFDIKPFSMSTLKRICSADSNLVRLLSLYGYANVRNIGLVIAQILKSDVIVFLDDDVVVNDPKYFRKAREHIGSIRDGKLLGGIAGYYIDEDGSYYLRVDPKSWWKLCWPKEKMMNEAFRVIENEQRLMEASFAFGGNMLLHWNMFEKVPFDPYITRGEDMDLLVNARMFGFKFLLDTELRVLHLPGEGKRRWSEMRQDLYRFLYMRQKLFLQKNIRTIKRDSIGSLEPYPGHFLHFGVSFKFLVSSCLNSLHSVQKKNFESFREFICNAFQIPSALNFSKSHRVDYFQFQRKWESYLPKIRDDAVLRNVLESSS